MKHLFTLCALLVCLHAAQAQSGRKLPYPIIFVHGLTGSDETWYEFASYLQTQYGLSAHTLKYSNAPGGKAGDGSRLDFDLNYDNNLSSSDARSDYADLVNEQRLGDNDMYIINFDTGIQSNQSAVHKQGLAVRDAVRHVRNVTGADKVILMGHSMGGLAARDYIQNTRKWQSDGQHHVAKLVTVGTPHGGSDGSLGPLVWTDSIDELSEAVRDLRYFYSSGYSGAYLFGGYENRNAITGKLLNFKNVDVDCNGRTGDYVEGLNRKPSIVTNLAYATVIGAGINTLPNGVNGDGVVELDRADLTKYYTVTQDAFYVSKLTTSTVFEIHRALCKNYPYQNLQALDEPGTNFLAYEIRPGNVYSGFFSPQANTSLRDVDRYKVYVSEKGIFSVATSALPSYAVTCQIIDENGVDYGSRYSANGSAIRFTANVPRAGWYYLSFEASSFDNTVWSYSYSTAFQAVLDKPTIALSGPQLICSGQSVTLQGPPGYVAYRWYKNGEKVQDGSNLNYAAASTGNYALLVSRNSVDSPLSDLVTVTVNATPPVPAVSARSYSYCVGEVAQPISATGTQIQWYAQATGGLASGNAPVITTSVPQALIYYATQTSATGCESPRQPVTVNVTALPPAPGIVASQFVCQFSPAVPLVAQGQGLLWRGAGLSAAGETTPSPATDKVDTLHYTVTQRLGSCVSPAVAVTVVVRKAPDLPKVVTPAAVCIDSPPVPLTATGSGIRWYAKADRSGRVSSSISPPTTSSGQLTYYATQTDASGCESLIIPVSVTIKPEATASLPADTALYRYDSLAVRITLTADAPWRVTLWDGRELTVTQSPLFVFVRPTATTDYALQSVANECGTGPTGRPLRITVIEPLALTTPPPDDLYLGAYPTPTEDALQVVWTISAGQSGTLQLTNLTGQLIWQRPVRGSGRQQTEPLSLGTQPSGHYLLQLRTQRGVLSRKIIKQ